MGTILFDVTSLVEDKNGYSNSSFITYHQMDDLKRHVAPRLLKSLRESLNIVSPEDDITNNARFKQYYDQNYAQPDIPSKLLRTLSSLLHFAPLTSTKNFRGIESQQWDFVHDTQVYQPDLEKLKAIFTTGRRMYWTVMISELTLMNDIITSSFQATTSGFGNMINLAFEQRYRNMLTTLRPLVTKYINDGFKGDIVTPQGVTLQMDGEFPRFVFKLDTFTFTTPPYGMLIDIANCVISEDGVQNIVQEINLYIGINTSDLQSRLAMLLNTIPAGAIPATKNDICIDGLLTPNTLTSLVSQHVANLGSVFKVLGVRKDITSVRNLLYTIVPTLTLLSMGQYEVLYRMIAVNPKLKIITPTPGIPYETVDLIDPSILKDPKISKFNPPVSLVDSAYRLMDPTTIIKYLTDNEYHTGSNPVDTITNLDLMEEGILDARQNLLSKTPYQAIMSGRSKFEIQYYVASRGFTVNKGMNPAAMMIAVMIQEGGGLGKTIQQACPFSDKFITYIKSLCGVDMTKDVITDLRKLLELSIEFDLLSSQSVYDVIRRGYVTPLPLSSDKLRLKAAYDLLTVDERRYMSKIDTSLNNEISLRAYIDRKPHPFDAYLPYIKSGNITDIAPLIGMHIPSWVENTLEYFINNVSSYIDRILNPSKVSRLNKPASSLTDQEIMEVLGGYVGYSSRAYLEAIYTSSQYTSYFFIPYSRKCANKYTFTGEDTTDNTLIVIAYGNINEYICYSPEDLIEGFKPYGLNMDSYEYRIYQQNGKTQRLTINEIDSVKCIARTYMTIAGADETLKTSFKLLFDSIDAIDRSKRATGAYEQGLVNIFKILPSDVKVLLVEFLREVFYLTMYMRQWKGPGNPFPYTEEESIELMKKFGLNTASEDNIDTYTEGDLDLKLTPIINAARDTQDRLLKMSKHGHDSLMGFNGYDYSSGGPVRLEETTFNDMWVGIYTGNFCIRSWSKKMATTVDHYLYLFGYDHIDGFDPTRINEIR
jgi:hypothetical protein